MIDPYTPVLAFTLGFLAGHVLQPWRVRQWQRWLGELLPYRCPSCGRWHSKRNVRFAEHRTAGWIFICQDCYDEQYHPFTEEQS